MMSRNQACPCGSGKKYKMCCLGKLDRETEEYYGLLHRESIIRSKLMRLALAQFSKEELDEYAMKFNGKTFSETLSGDEAVSFLDWFFMEARHDGKRILQAIRELAARDFSQDELRIIDEMIANTHAGILEVQQIVSERHAIVAKDIFTAKEYEITDIRGCAALLKGDVFYGRVQTLFSHHYLSGAAKTYPRMILGQFKSFLNEQLELQRKTNPQISYEDFMDTSGHIINRFEPKPPKIFAATGEEAVFCEAVYALNPQNARRIVDWFAGNDEFVVADHEYGRNGELKLASIGRICREEPQSTDGVVSRAHWESPSGDLIPIAGNINLKGKKMTVSSLSKVVFAELKGILENNFSSFITLEKENIQTTEQAMRRRVRAEPTEKNQKLTIEFLTRYYTEWCDQEIPALGGKTPRQATTTAEGRARLKELLLDIENNRLHKQRRGESYFPAEKIIRKTLNFYE
ncbi:SEC-C domain-containing protein [Candidatus Woesearchaeota archaeon]|nr:SEC-C domain-containing protein [Candidatus Woesearchaeota archaeon]